jgi:hypothetical protein
LLRDIVTTRRERPYGGRDLLARLLWTTRFSLAVAIVAALGASPMSALFERPW